MVYSHKFDQSTHSVRLVIAFHRGDRRTSPSPMKNWSKRWIDFLFFNVIIQDEIYKNPTYFYQLWIDPLSKSFLLDVFSLVWKTKKKRESNEQWQFRLKGNIWSSTLHVTNAKGFVNGEFRLEVKRRRRKCLKTVTFSSKEIRSPGNSSQPAIRYCDC